MPDPSQVLVVDDHPRMVALIKRWLVRAGYRVTGVTTVQEALEALTANSIAWVITDLMMPTGDGMDILSYARTHHPQAKIIIMTAFGSDATRQRAFARGAHAFLSKPFSGEALLAILTQEPPSEPTPSAAGGDQHAP
ncbi:MAG: response regulator [Candidatus Entotheonellia bacterium]